MMVARPYEPVDRADCLRIFESNTPTYFLPEERSQFEKFLDRLPGPYFVILNDDDVVACGGYATGRVEGEADVCWTIVHGNHRGQGVGSYLMTTCLRAISARGDCRVARLETSQHTRTFFERWGFSAIDVTPNGFGPGLDQIEMRVELGTGPFSTKC